MKNTIDTLIGGGAIGAVEAVEQTPIPDDAIKLAMQGFIAIVSLISMLVRQNRDRKARERASKEANG